MALKGVGKTTFLEMVSYSKDECITGVRGAVTHEEAYRYQNAMLAVPVQSRRLHSGRYINTMLVKIDSRFCR